MGDNSDRLDEEVSKYLESESPWSRVGLLFKKDSIGYSYEEGVSVKKVIFYGTMAAGLIAFYPGARSSYRNYRKATAVTVYKSAFAAEKIANDAYFYGGMKWAMRYGFVAWLGLTGFVYTAQILELYRLKTSCVHYAFAGTLVGAFARLPLGPKGIAAGGLLGCYAGTMLGYIVTKTLKLGDIHVEARHRKRIAELLSEKKHLDTLQNKYNQELEATLKLKNSIIPKHETMKSEIV